MADWGDGLPFDEDSSKGDWGDGLPFGPSVDSLTVVSAVAIDAYHVRVVFSAETFHVNPVNANDALNPANYTFSVVGGVTITAVSVTTAVASPTEIIILLNKEMTNGAIYTVTVNHVTDLSGVLIDPAANSANFIGIGIAPWVLSAVSHYRHVILTYDSAMVDNADLINPANYTFIGPTALTAVSVSVISQTQVDILIVGHIIYGETYTVYVDTSSTIEDLSLNKLDPAHNYAHFVGIDLEIIWVSKEGNDALGDGTQFHPYLTIERALQDFTNGDQIRIMEGVYATTDTIMISGLEGSIFAEAAASVTIQPVQTSINNAAVVITDSTRFTVKGINIVQSDTDTRHVVGIYADNVENFIAHTCAITDFESPSGNVTGIFARGTGRIENCRIEDIDVVAGMVYGINSYGLDVIDCTAKHLVSRQAGAWGIKAEALP